MFNQISGFILEFVSFILNRIELTELVASSSWAIVIKVAESWLMMRWLWLWLWPSRNLNVVKSDSTSSLNFLKDMLILLVVHSYTNSTLSSSGCSSWSVDISLNISRWFNLDNKFNVRNVKASACYICGDKTLDFAFLELSQSLLSLWLGNITMHWLIVDSFNFKVACVSFCLGEDDCSSSVGVMVHY